MAAITRSQSKREFAVQKSAKESTEEPTSVGKLEETSGGQTDPVEGEISLDVMSENDVESLVSQAGSESHQEQTEDEQLEVLYSPEDVLPEDDDEPLVRKTWGSQEQR